MRFTRILAAAALTVLPLLGAHAMPVTADVELESDSPSETVLVSTATGQKPKETAAMAVKQAFYALMHQGVEGVHNGQPMIAGDAKAYEYRFFKENKYIDYLTGTPVKLDASNISGQKRVRMRVGIRTAALLKDLSTNKITLNPAWIDSKQTPKQPSVNPTIVVVPYIKSGYDDSFEGMKRLIDEDPAMKYAVEKVTSMFSANGYKTRDFIAWLQNSKTNDIVRGDAQRDAATMVVQELPGDIAVTVDVNVNAPADRRRSCNVALKAVERQTTGNLASTSMASGEYITSDATQIVDYALAKMNKEFFRQLSDAFNSMVENGREVSLEFNLGPNVADWDFDQETPLTGEDFKDALEDWLRETSLHDNTRMAENTDKFIAASINIPLWNHEKGRAYTLNNFNSALRKFMKQHLGDEYKASAKAMGQKIIVIIE